MTDFQKIIIQIVGAIPKGETMSYGQVAHLAGRPGAARAVGSFLAQNTNTNVPCHRVIRADGKIGKYNGLLGSSKKALLEKEGWSPKGA